MTGQAAREVMALDATLEQSLQFVYESYLGAAAGGATDIARHPEFIQELANLAGIMPPKDLLVVTGSKGKGSVSALAAAALSGAGRRCGLVTSPHLLHLTERIRIDGQAISDEELQGVADGLRPLLRRYAATLPSGVYVGPSGIYLLLALTWFHRQGIDTAVVEAGRGGLLDESTRFGHRVAAITTVRLEHLSEIGPELRDVARHKAGAIPSRGLAVSAYQDPVAMTALTERADLLGARLLLEGEDLIGKSSPPLVTVVTPRSGGPRSFPFRPAGAYQAGNAALALAAAEALVGAPIDAPSWADLQLPGRLQQVGTRPDVIVDGAIVRESAEAAVRLAQDRGRSPLVAVIGVPSDKDYRGVIAAAGAAAARMVITRTATPRLRYPQDALQFAETFAPATEVRAVPEALKEASRLATPTGLVLVLGTQSLVAEVLHHYQIDPRHIYG